jgi:uncharacterized membrane protein YwzB
MTPLYQYGSAVPVDVIFVRLWWALKGISIEKLALGYRVTQYL